MASRDLVADLEEREQKSLAKGKGAGANHGQWHITFKKKEEKNGQAHCRALLSNDFSHGTYALASFLKVHIFTHVRTCDEI